MTLTLSIERLVDVRFVLFFFTGPYYHCRGQGEDDANPTSLVAHLGTPAIVSQSSAISLWSASTGEPQVVRARAPPRGLADVDERWTLGSSSTFRARLVIQGGRPPPLSNVNTSISRKSDAEPDETSDLRSHQRSTSKVSDSILSVHKGRNRLGDLMLSNADRTR